MTHRLQIRISFSFQLVEVHVSNVSMKNLHWFIFLTFWDKEFALFVLFSSFGKGFCLFLLMNF